ncbi:unnamed protein product [Rhizophagus irregularis]|nr:unnamed protein product [Rhizophagus irregularis]
MSSYDDEIDYLAHCLRITSILDVLRTTLKYRTFMRRNGANMHGSGSIPKLMKKHCSSWDIGRLLCNGYVPIHFMQTND